jgi:anti-anti-sigma factor
VKENNIHILRLDGNVDFATAGALEAKITELVDGGAVKLLVNFEKVPFIASAGLRVLLKCAKRLQSQSGSLCVCGANEVVREVFEFSGFVGTVFKIFDSEQDALQAID